MRLELLGWSSAGLRATDLEIELVVGADRVPRVTLLQMPNGTGKTTTLACMRAAMTGEAQHWSVDKVRQFAPSGRVSEKGEFEIRLRVDSRPLTIHMLFDFDEMTVTYHTTFRRGRVGGYKPPAELRRFLSEHFVRLLIFDGEMPGALLEPREAEAQQAIQSFFQLYLLDNMKAAIDQIWERASSEASATEMKGLSQRRNAVTRYERKLEELKTARRDAKQRIDELAKSETEKRERLAAIVGQSEELRKEHDDLVGKIRDAEESVRGGVQGLMDQIRLPHRVCPGFTSALVGMKVQLDRLKLPETSSRQFFEELIEETNCICGRPLDQNTRAHIQENAAQYMGAEAAGTVNSLKSDIGRLVESEESTDVLAMVGRVRHESHQRDALVSSLNAVLERLEEEGDDEVRRLREEIAHAGEQRGELEELLEEIEGAPTSEDRRESSKCLAFWEGELDEAKKKLAEITRTVELKKHTEVVTSILDDSARRARETIGRTLLREMNKTVDQLLPGHGIHIEAIDRSVVLSRQEGASQGQTLAVGYAFLTTLFEKGQHAFPFVVDAPVLALDTRVSAEVGSAIPRVCAQFVGFVLDRERDGFVSSLEQEANGDVRFLTAFEDSERNAPLCELLPANGVTRTGNGILVQGKEFFERVTFQAERDSDG